MDLALLRRLSLNHLATFITIAESGSFRSAAVRLNISQSALSVHIRQLERMLEVKLLDRTTRSVALTAEGYRLLPVAQMLATELTGTAKLLTEEARAKKRIVRFATVPFTLSRCPPDLLKTFCDRHPGIEVRLAIRESSTMAEELVKNGEADIGLVYRKPEHDGRDFCAVFYETLMAVVPAGESAFAGMTGVTLRELARFPFVIQPEGTFMREVLDSNFASQNIEIRSDYAVLHADGLIALVRAGLGVAVLPAGVLSLLNVDGCRVIPLKEVSQQPVGLILAPKVPSSTATLALRDFILETSREH